VDFGPGATMPLLIAAEAAACFIWFFQPGSPRALRTNGTPRNGHPVETAVSCGLLKGFPILQIRSLRTGSQKQEKKLFARGELP